MTTPLLPHKRHPGPVTAKLCKSAKGARDAEMGLHPAQLWTESAFGKSWAQRSWQSRRQ